jgi:hypothetical protein
MLCCQAHTDSVDERSASAAGAQRASLAAAFSALDPQRRGATLHLTFMHPSHCRYIGAAQSKLLFAALDTSGDRAIEEPGIAQHRTAQHRTAQ